MSSPDEKRPKTRSGQRGGKAKQAGPKADQRQSPRPHGRQDEEHRVEAAVALNEALPPDAGTPPPDPAAIEPADAPAEPRADTALVPVSPTPIAVAGPVETFSIGFDTVAHAYSAYAWRSIEETMGLVEKLTVTRSLDKTIEIQNEFTRKACEGFLADSQEAWRLYGEFTRQIFRSFEHLLIWRAPIVR